MSQARPGLRQALAALGYRDYQYFALATLLTSIGLQILTIATLWQVYLLTQNALALGLTGLARALPHIALSLIGGVIADRFDRVRMVQVAQAANALLVGVLAVLTVTGLVDVWHLYAVTFLNSAFSALTQPARTALIPNLLPRHHLVNAVALNSTMAQMATIVGPAIGGVMIGWLDLPATYLVNALAYGVSMVALAMIRPVSVPPTVDGSPWTSFIEGMAFVREKPVISALMGMDLAATVLGSYRALLPLFAVSLGAGPEGLGLMGGAPGVGSVLGATLIMSLGDVRYKGLYTVFGIVGYCAALVLLAVSPWFTLALLACGLLGFTDSVQMIPRNSAILAITPDELRGRVESFRTMLSGGGPPLGFATSGALASALGPSLALILGAGACALVILGVVTSRRDVRDPELGMLTEEPDNARPIRPSPNRRF